MGNKPCRYLLESRGASHYTALSGSSLTDPRLRSYGDIARPYINQSALGSVHVLENGRHITRLQVALERYMWYRMEKYTQWGKLNRRK